MFRYPFELGLSFFEFSGSASYGLSKAVLVMLLLEGMGVQVLVRVRIEFLGFRVQPPVHLVRPLSHVGLCFAFTVPRNPDFSLNVDRIAEAVELEKPKCIFLTSPNNPDGR